MSYIRCPKCNQIINSNFRECAQCGHKIDDSEFDIAIAESGFDKEIISIERKEEAGKTIIESDEIDSSGAGFLLGILLGILGLIIAWAIGKPNVIRGSKRGFWIGIIIEIIFIIIKFI